MRFETKPSLRVFHPLVLAIFPILSIYRQSQLFIAHGIRPLAYTFGIIILVWFLLYLMTRNWERAAFLTSAGVVMVLFVNYNTATPENLLIWRSHIKSAWIIVLFWILILLVLNSRLIWGRIRPHVLTRFLNATSLILILIPAYYIAQNTVREIQDPIQQWQVPNIKTIPKLKPDDESYPDIYYIIVDGYAREDVLNELYGYENSQFLNFLRERGFFISEKSQSNYIQTTLSLSSSLNMDYLDNLGLSSKLSTSREPVKKLIRNNLVATILKNSGYQFIALSSGYEFTEIPNADVYLSPQRFTLTTEESFLVYLTGIKVVFNLFNLGNEVLGYETHRARFLFQMQELDRISAQISEKPRFIFTHLVIPHPPFIFDQTGQLKKSNEIFLLNDGNFFKGTQEEYIHGYIDQLIFLNHMLEKHITTILQNSKDAPIIILQADHGPGSLLELESVDNSCLKERFSILNAYYLPGINPGEVINDISPVNSFRLILDEYFGTELGLLENYLFFSTWSNPYDFIDVTNKIEKSCTR